MREEKGYTLIELVIAVSLIGIVSAMAAPQFLQMAPKMRVDSATRQVVSEMLSLKFKAISENRKYRIIFGQPNGNQYQVQQDGNRDDDYTDAADTFVKTVTLPETIVFGTNASKNTSGDPVCDDAICFGSDNGASFKPIGTSDTGSLYLIPTEDKGSGKCDRMRAVSVNNAGRVKAWRYKGGSSPWSSF